MSTSDEDLLKRLEEIYSHGPGSQVDRAATFIAGELERLGADAGFVARVTDDGGSIEVARVTPYSANPVRLGFPLDAPYPIAEVIRGGRALFIASNEQLRCDHPGLVRVKGEDHACATVPVCTEGGELIGVLNIGFEDPREFDEASQEAIVSLAARCATLLAES